MKPRLQTSLGQQLVLTPQLRQALHLLQLSALELEAEITEALETNPLLEWEEDGEPQVQAAESHQSESSVVETTPEAEDWDPAEDAWYERSSFDSGSSDPDQDNDASQQVAKTDSLQDHLSWQLHLSPLSPRDRAIGATLVDAIDEDGYLREPLAAIAEALRPDIDADAEEIQAVLSQIQRLDPVGVGARDLGECLALQLQALPDDTPGRAIALHAAATLIDRLPKLGPAGLASEAGCTQAEADIALQLLRSLDPRPGARYGDVPSDNYVVPDCVITRHNGIWRVTLASNHQSRLTIHRGYERMIQHAADQDAGYLRGRLQEARWLLKNLEARGETLLKVVRCLVSQQSGFLEFGARALRPLTLREVAAEIGMHESTVSRAVARKYVRTPRGTLALRDFFASGISTGVGGGEASSVAIQQMIRGMIEAEDPRKPLSDARLAESLKASGIPVARRTVAKYREAMNIAASHERVRIA